MTITLIGHLCVDEFERSGRTVEGFGGIYYALAALGTLLGEEDRVRPVFGVGADEHDALMDALAAFPVIDRSGIFRFEGPTNRVSLTFMGDGGRGEVSRDIAKPIGTEKILPALDADMVLVNMISGFDITLETLDEIRMQAAEKRVPVYLDIHSLTLGVRPDFRRFHTRVELWRRWLFMLHAAQMNETEASVLTGGQYAGEDLIKQIVSLGTRTVMITRGERGATLYHAERKQHVTTEIPPAPTRPAADPTGCGDVFGAAYCAHYVRTKDVAASAHFANRVAGAKAGISGSDGLAELAAFANASAHVAPHVAPKQS